MEAKRNTILALSALLIILLACTLSPTPQPQPTIESSQHPSPTPRLPRPPLQPPLASPTRPPRDTQPATITPTRPTPPKATETRPVQPTQAETMDDPSVVFSQDYAGEDVSIYYAFLSEDGSSLVVFLDNSQIQVINMEEGWVATFPSPLELIPSNNTAISVQEEQILIVDYPWQEIGAITLWQVIPGEEARVVATISETDAWLTDLAFSPDGKTLAVGFNVGEIRLYRTSDGTRLRTIKAFHDFVMYIAYSRDGRYIIADSTSFDSNSYVFDAENGSKVATLSTESWEPGQVSFSPDGKLAAATAGDGTHIFTTSNWQATGVVIGGVWNGTFTCDSQGFMEGMGNQVSLYSLTSGQKTGAIEIPDPGDFYCLADGRMVILDWFVRSNRVQVKLVEP